MIAAACVTVSRDPDTELMLRLQRGEQDALQPLLERNQGLIVNLAYRYGVDPHRAEELAQETFLRVYQARERYRPERPFGAYLLRIATNLCLSRLRRVKARRTFVDHDAADNAANGAVHPDDDVLRAELRQRVRTAVANLPDRQRTAIVLQRFEGLSCEQVGRAIGLSVPATKSLLHRARAALRERLDEYRCVS
jgi:RNA polymerase sigma-70 factor (ECF subfamily)